MKARYFRIEELVTREIFKARGEKAWELIDERVVITIDKLREKFGPIIINTWHQGGVLDERGLRNFLHAEGTEYSQHKFGRACDCSFKAVTAEEVRQYVLKSYDEFPYITCVERDVSWFHFDVRNHNYPMQIMVVSP